MAEITRAATTLRSGLGALATVTGVVGGGVFAAGYSRRATVAISAEVHRVEGSFFVATRPSVTTLGPFSFKFKAPAGAVVEVCEVLRSDAGGTRDGQSWTNPAFPGNQDVGSGETLKSCVLFAVKNPDHLVGWRVCLNVSSRGFVRSGLHWADRVFVAVPGNQAIAAINSLVAERDLLHAALYGETPAERATQVQKIAELREALREYREATDAHVLANVVGGLGSTDWVAFARWQNATNKADAVLARAALTVIQTQFAAPAEADGGDAKAEPPSWLNGDCPGGFDWSNCCADDCGVGEDGIGCEFAAPAPGEPNRESAPSGDGERA